MKKIYLLLSSLFVLVNIFANGVEVNGIFYLFSGSNATVTYPGTVHYEKNTYTGVIEIPSSVKYNNSPYNVTAIGMGAFCNTEQLVTVIIPESVVSIGARAFSASSDLKYISIPGSVKTIEEDAFNSCEYLREVTLNEGVKWLESGAFTYCTSLKKILLPSSLESLGESCFENCTGLTSIECGAVNPPSCEERVFYAVNKQIPVYVPKNSVGAYKNAAGWKEFNNIQAKPSTGLENIKKSSMYEGVLYNLNGQVVNKSYQGIVILNGCKYIQLK